MHAVHCQWMLPFCDFCDFFFFFETGCFPTSSCPIWSMFERLILNNGVFFFCVELFKKWSLENVSQIMHFFSYRIIKSGRSWSLLLLLKTCLLQRLGVKDWIEHLPFMEVNVNSHMGVNKATICESWELIAILNFVLSCFLTVFQLYFQIKKKKKILTR